MSGAVCWRWVEHKIREIDLDGNVRDATRAQPVAGRHEPERIEVLRLIDRMGERPSHLPRREYLRVAVCKHCRTVYVVDEPKEEET